LEQRFEPRFAALGSFVVNQLPDFCLRKNQSVSSVPSVVKTFSLSVKDSAAARL
jgi:hypothetical protein